MKIFILDIPLIVTCFLGLRNGSTDFKDYTDYFLCHEVVLMAFGYVKQRRRLSVTIG